MTTTTLSPLPPAVSNNLVTYIGGASTYINFINHLTVDAKLSWINTTGNRVLYAVLKPGEAHRQQTYVGHPWEVVAERANFKADYLPVAYESNVIIEQDVGDITTLTPLAAAEVTEDLRSTVESGPPATVINFINRLDVNVKVYWIDHAGERVLHATLRPGEMKHQKTYVGHPWEVVPDPYFKYIYIPIETESNVILKRDVCITNGKTYTIVNGKTGTVLDLSGIDGIAVSGYASHGGDNQKWVLESVTENWTLKNKFWGRYLGIQPGGIQPGAPLSGSAHPIQWDIRPEATPDTYRIVIPGARNPLNVDLSGSSPDNGTPVILYERLNPGKNQTWRFVECEETQS